MSSVIEVSFVYIQIQNRPMPLKENRMINVYLELSQGIKVKIQNNTLKCLYIFLWSFS